MSQASSSGPSDPLDAQLSALEKEIRGAVDTLGRLDEFLEPSENPDNEGYAYNLNEFVRNLNAIQDASNIDLPFKLPPEVIKLVDYGRSPDDHTIEMYRKAKQGRDGFDLKAHAFEVMETRIRDQAGALLEDVEERT